MPDGTNCLGPSCSSTSLEVGSVCSMKVEFHNRLIECDLRINCMSQGKILLSLKRPEAAVLAFRGAQDLRSDLRSYQGAVFGHSEVNPFVKFN